MTHAKALIIGVAWSLFASTIGAQTVAPCTATSANHQRWTMKTRPRPATVDPAAVTTLSVQDLVKWSVPVGKKLDNKPIDPRENQILTVTGWVRLVKISRDDCDIHIQLGAFPDKHIPQIIAEIPQSGTAVRQALAAKLGVDIPKPGRTLYFDGPKAVQITVTGPAFDDSSHWAKAHPKIGNSHGSGVGTLWEIHPVWEVR